MGIAAWLNTCLAFTAVAMTGVELNELAHRSSICPFASWAMGGLVVRARTSQSIIGGDAS